MNEAIKPPWTGQFWFRNLLVHPNTRVQALARHLLAPPFNYIPDDRLCGQMISRLCDYFIDYRDGRYNCSRIRVTQAVRYLGLRRLRTALTTSGFFPMIDRDYAVVLATGLHGPITLDIDFHRCKIVAVESPSLWSGN